MKFLKTNLSILDTHFPKLAQELRSRKILQDSDIEIEFTPSGHPTLRARGNYVHSGRNPQREAERLAYELTGEDPILLLGFGLGYLGEALRKWNPERMIVVVEARLSLLRQALEVRDLAFFLESQPLIIAAGGKPDDLVLILQLLGKAPQVVVNPALKGLNQAWYEEAERLIRTWKAKDEINAATLRRFGQRWVKNMAMNLPHLREFPGIDHIQGSVQDIPALIVAAGPSLDNILPYLKEFYQRCLLIVVDTSLKQVLERGVDPDFVVVVDPQYWNARHLDRCAAPRSALVTEAAVYPATLQNTYARVFLCSSRFPLASFMEERVDPKGRLGAGGSVVTTAWDLARFLGANPIWIAGLDLGFPGLKTHFRGAFFEQRALQEAWRLYPAETHSYQALASGGPHYASSLEGGRVLTDKRMTLYAAWFEEQFKRFPEYRTRSLAPEGLAIEGLELGTPEELLALPHRRKEIDQCLVNYFFKAEECFAHDRSDRIIRYHRAVETLRKELGTISFLANKARKAAGDALKGMVSIHWAITELDRIEKLIYSSTVKDIAGFLLPPELVKAKKVDEDNKVLVYLRDSTELYTALATTSGHMLRTLSHFLQAQDKAADTYSNGD